MKAWLNGIILLFGLMFNPAFAQCGFDQEMNELLADFIDLNMIPGAVVSIKLPDHSICNYTAGYADISSKKPMTAETLFYVGSINKSFNSVALLQLQQAGKLKFTDSINTFSAKKSPLALLIKKYPRLAFITIQELANHTSGLPEVFTTQDYAHAFLRNPEFHTDAPQLLKFALQQKNWGPREQFHFTNTDYILAGLIIEAVTEKPLAETFHHLLTEADINDTSFPSSEKSAVVSKELAQGYMAVNSHWPEPFKRAMNRYTQVYIDGGNHDPLRAYNVTNVDLAQLSVGAAAGGMLMSTPDMIKWYEYLFVTKNSFTPSLIQKLISAADEHQNVAYGFGIETNFLPDYGYTVYSHNGSFFGYNTNLIYIKNNNIIIAMAINAQRDKLRLNQELAKSIMGYLKNAGYFAQYDHQNSPQMENLPEAV
jgi:D-alanyl-D-alanine carboxypeptidase